MKSIFKVVPVLAAGLSSAFLLPPTVSDNVRKEIEAIHDTLAAKFADLESVVKDISRHDNLFHRKVELNCPNCPFYEGEVDGGYRVWTKTPNSLVFNIATDPKQPMSLTVNGMDIIHPKAFDILTAPQTPHNKDHLVLLNRLADPRVNLNYEIFMKPVSLKIRNFRIHVMSVDKFRTSRDMEIISMDVARDHEDILHIVKLEVRPPTPAEASVAECKMNTLCRWKAYFADTLSRNGFGMKKPGCHGKNPSIMGGKLHDRPPHHHHGDNSHTMLHDDKPEYRHRHGHFHLAKIISFAISAVVLPIAFGIAAGIFVSFIGVVLAHIVVMSYRWATGRPYSFLPKCDGCHQGGNKEEEAGLLSEKAYIIIEDEESELPAYTDSEGVLRGDEKSEL